MFASKVAVIASFLIVVVSVSTATAGEAVPANSITRGPYLQALTHESVEILWTTVEPAQGRVLVTSEDGEELEFPGPWRRSHRSVLSGLAAATSYTYEIYDRDERMAGGDGFRFETAPEPGTGSFRAFVLGDSGVGGAVQRQLGGLMSSYDVPLILHTGDLAYFPNLDTVVFEPYEELLRKSCLYVTRGNHDLELRENGIVWRDHFAVPGAEPGRERAYFSFDFGPAHFLALDYYTRFANDSAQDDFAIADLEAARGRGVRWLVIFLHVPIYTVGQYGGLQHPLRQKIPEWCDRFGVDLVFSGHDHNFQRTHPVRAGVVRDAWQGAEIVEPAGTVYVVTGGGGVGLYDRNRFPAIDPLIHTFVSRHHVVHVEASEQAFSLRAIGLAADGREDLEPIDVVTLRKGAPRPPFRVLRGDANSDLEVDVSDPVAILEALFLGRDLLCQPAASARGPGERVLITDAIYLLNFLFTGGAPPAPPFPECGSDHEVSDAFCYASPCAL